MKKFALLFCFLLSVYSFDLKEKYPFCHPDSQEMRCLTKIYDWSQTKLPNPNWEGLPQEDAIFDISSNGEIGWTAGILKHSAEKAVSIWRDMNFDSSYFLHFWMNHYFGMMGIRFASKNGGQDYIYVLEGINEPQLFTEEKFLVNFQRDNLQFYGHEGGDYDGDI